MRLRRRAEEATLETGVVDAQRLAAWDGLRGQPGAGAVIRAARAAELAPVEVRQVA